MSDATVPAANPGDEAPSAAGGTSSPWASLPWRLRVEIEENLLRKPFSQAELAAVQRRLIAEFSGVTPKRKGSPRSLLQESTPTSREVGAARRKRWQNATERVAHLFHEGEKAVRERLAVVEAAEEDPKQFGPLLEEMEETQNVHGAFEVLQGRRTMSSLKSSKSVEWYTPEPYVEAARQVLGRIDLDPCSSEIANQTVRAARFFTAEDDGLKQEWRGKLWMNPPYCRQQGRFVKKLLRDYVRGHVTEAILLLNGYSYDAAWFQALWDFTLCFARERIDFTSPDGPSKFKSGHGSVFVFIGSDWRRFARVFQRFGRVVRAVDLPDGDTGGDDASGDDSPPGDAPVPVLLPFTPSADGANALGVSAAPEEATS